jgi:hypothetical protein
VGIGALFAPLCNVRLTHSTLHVVEYDLLSVT